MALSKSDTALLALHRAGRASDALEAYTRHARRLDDELGLQPGAELRELQTAVLRQAPELAAWPRHPEWNGAVEVRHPDGFRATGSAAGGLVTACRSRRAPARLPRDELRSNDIPAAYAAIGMVHADPGGFDAHSRGSRPAA